MGQGYYFRMETSAAARTAAHKFYLMVTRNFRRKAHPLGITRTIDGHYISGIDVCGPHSDKIDKLHNRIQQDASNGR